MALATGRRCRQIRCDQKVLCYGGCDGRMKSRAYYTEFAEKLPKDTVILTAGCAKYRYNKLKLGDIGGIPRVLDAGQCNDSYSLAVIALKLKEVFGLDDINKLPIAFNIACTSRSVIVLLALLYLGVRISPWSHASGIPVTQLSQGFG
jgi:hydroxylamine reductase